MKRLHELSFIDLIVGRDYFEIKGMKGGTSFLSELPCEYEEDAGILKTQCLDIHMESNKTEFSLRYDERIYRITVIRNDFDGISFVIRQTPESVLPFNDIPLTTDLRRSIELPGATGLFLISGEMGSGKTTTAASIIRHRIAITGNLGVTIEDPIETLLHGRHGQGRCMQLEVSQNETYASATKKAWRTGASCLLLGEIRDSQTAHEVLMASLTMFVISTIHASSVFEAIERYVMFCEENNPNAKQNVANTLFVVAHQKMNQVIRHGQIKDRNVDINGYNLVHCQQHQSIKTKIVNGNYKSLVDEFNGMNYKF